MTTSLELAGVLGQTDVVLSLALTHMDTVVTQAYVQYAMGTLQVSPSFRVEPPSDILC